MKLQMRYSVAVKGFKARDLSFQMNVEQCIVMRLKMSKVQS